MDDLICRSCRSPVEIGDLICLTCNANLTAAGAVVRRGAMAPSPSRCGDCGAVLPADAVLCPDCLRPAHRQVFLVLSTGWRHALAPDSTLVLGRDPAASPAAAALADFDSVSRRHASLTLDGSGALTVTDHDSTNGTFVDGVRVEAGGSAPVPIGATLRLASTASFKLETD